MLTIQFNNDGTGTPEIGNYDVGVFVNDYCIYQTRIEKYKRELGWRPLVLALAWQATEDDVFEKYDDLFKALGEL